MSDDTWAAELAVIWPRAKPVTGCKGKKPASFDSLKPEQVRAALSALNTAALEIEIGADRAKPLAATINAYLRQPTFSSHVEGGHTSGATVSRP